MRTFTLIAVAMLLSLSFLQSTNAQCPTPAPNDYPNIPFIGTNTTTLETPMGSGCFITFQWCWRTTPFNDGEVEIYIGAISRSTGCTGPFNMNDLIRIAARFVIVDEHPWTTTNGGAGKPVDTPIPPCPALSKTMYRILHASCYSEEFFDPTTANIVRTPCGNGNIGRCEEVWRVCFEFINGLWHLNENLVSIVNNGATCPATTNNAAGRPIRCQRICQ
ncbi:MAG: hypothetical protein IPM69_07260 [Ignavibacteria bacterium]|nr:hypothetical protein [Ignavibacteria bacterium]